ncbi:fluoride efflux transporter FluC [Herbiconiux sp. SYSU D00978]|uniref:fluoride efflux transporter FluC n=1 Tax=Herbiconiux sp. SYSU D00978 TaxID=2812562 RepID=UPI001A962BC6|nr:CrcB family protein [Herbiconiux sp. SYSU D00978]
MSRAADLGAVALGGLAGGAVRLAVDSTVPPGAFPWGTLAINTLGSLVLALLAAWLWPVAPRLVRLGVGPGLLGAFTTFSAVAVSAITLPLAAAVTYIVATLVLGFAAALGGLALGRALTPPADAA